MTMSPSLRTITVEGLFGRDRVEISLERKGPTVLTGSNGTGKSTILRLVWAASTKDLRALLTAPCRSFRLDFDGLPSFEFSRVKGGGSISWGKFDDIVRWTDAYDDLPEWARVVLHESPGSSPDERERAVFDEAQALGVPLEEFRTVRNLLSERSGEFSRIDIPEWMDEFAEQFPVLFVSDQRLISDTPSPRDIRGRAHGAVRGRGRRLAVEAASSDIAHQMTLADSSYTRSSVRNDREFPKNVIAALSNESVMNADRLADIIRKVNTRRSDLQRVGLLEEYQDLQADLPAEVLDRTDVQAVLDTFLRSSLRTMNVFAELADRLTTLKNFLDRRLHPKSLVLSRRQGMSFTIPGGSTVRPWQLSSGEQQILVLAYEILFRAREGTLVIIDEPEISLHVVWQDSLLSDLQEMGRANKVDFLMATHSPTILASHPEFERSLDLEID